MESELENWPVVEGRYKIGNKKSRVAVCTQATVEGIELDMEKVAIVGKCVTENIGLEKIIQNVVSNPYLRFLLLCGKNSKGHFPNQAIIALKENGVNREKSIIGAKGNLPFLKGIEESLIERFRQQIKSIDLGEETDSLKIMQAVDDCLKKETGVFLEKPLEIKKIEEITAMACPKWTPDPKGFFLIALDRNRAKIIIEHYKDSKPTKRIIGGSAEEISKTIAYLDLIADFEQTKEHAMYLGRELQKAELALKNNWDYEQDAPLLIKKGDWAEIKKEKADDDWFD